ncbi:Very-long-chain 3-oxoacyl-CoA reductase [Rhynchospora pubera]|uniref:Very-long-chain 3-oxoacyl-CoA reductase n=1 Tax=Rhynchospora pubera TaxID=906938 RepID=A0AAV8FP84_9POAL|nr:Very-long-chain 3-oxoacyl-CoA reductase [Rhynchospora pubera]
MNAITTHLTTVYLWFLILFSLGILSICKHLITLLRWVHAALFRPEKNLTDYGSWALVTGATDGIGKAIAFELANKGLNLLLLGRNQSKLQDVSNSIRSKHNSTKIKLIVLDLTIDMSMGINQLKGAIKGLDLGIVINNAGSTYPGAMYFHEADAAVWDPVIRVNVEATAWVTSVVVQKMAERGKRGAVVNIGSGSSVVVPAFPFYAVYAASKAFVDMFSKCLHVEYARMGIDIQCQIPMYVATKMVSTVKTSFFVPSPEQYARCSIRWIGYESRCTPYWPHAIQWWFCSFVPNFILNYVRLQIGIRKRSDRLRALSKIDDSVRFSD